MAYPSFHKEIDVCFFFFLLYCPNRNQPGHRFLFGTKQDFTQVNMNTQQILMIPSTSELKIF